MRILFKFEKLSFGVKVDQTSVDFLKVSELGIKSKLPGPPHSSERALEQRWNRQLQGAGDI